MEVVVSGFLVVASSLFAAFALLPIALRCGFVDHPNERKRHGTPVPLIGGLVVYFGLCMGLAVSGLWRDGAWWLFWASSTTLMVVGMVDDRCDLSARRRFLIQGCVILAAFLGAHLHIDQLGLLLGQHALVLDSALGVSFTVLCALAAVNAYNMIDGIDGLAGGVTLLTLVGLAVLLAVAEAHHIALLAGLVVLAIAVYLLFNLGVLRGRKMFLGDGGSTLLGFLVVWLLVDGSQRLQAFAPIIAVWLVGLPILDMLTVFARRVLSGRSPFSADRIHVHHILMDHGLSPRRTLCVLMVLHGTMVSVGVLGTVLQWSEFSLTCGVIGVGLSYMAANVWLSGRLRSRTRNPSFVSNAGR